MILPILGWPVTPRMVYLAILGVSILLIRSVGKSKGYYFTRRGNQCSKRDR